MGVPFVQTPQMKYHSVKKVPLSHRNKLDTLLAQTGFFGEESPMTLYSIYTYICIIFTISHHTTSNLPTLSGGALIWGNAQQLQLHQGPLMWFPVVQDGLIGKNTAAKPTIQKGKTAPKEKWI